MGIEGFETVIKFVWRFDNGGIVEATLFGEKYTLLAINSNGKEVKFSGDDKDYPYEEEMFEDLDFNLQGFIEFVQYSHWSLVLRRNYEVYGTNF